jgi:hypothetical protein
MADTRAEKNKVCAPYTREDAQTMKALRSVVRTAVLQMAEIEQRTLAKAGGTAKKTKGVHTVKVFLSDNSHEETWEDGSTTCDDATSGVCCTGACPC